MIKDRMSLIFNNLRVVGMYVLYEIILWLARRQLKTLATEKT